MPAPRRTFTTVAGAALALGVAACGATQPGATQAGGIRPVAHRAGGVYDWGSFGGQGLHGRITAMTSAPAQGAGGGRLKSRPMPVAGINGRIRQIASSNSDGYALTTRGAVYAWGTGDEGELGNGTMESQSLTAVRVHFPAGVRIAALPNPMPFDSGMAIDTRGRVWGWGNDENQQFCLRRAAYLKIPRRLPLTHVTLAVGAARHATYDAGGHIVSCGLGQYGQLGNGTTGIASQTATAVRVKGLPRRPVLALTAAYGDAGALMANGTYYDWGLNTGGQVGNGSTSNQATAVRVRLPSRVRAVYAGGSVPFNGQTTAILANGQLWEWGIGTYGEFGDGSTGNRTRPVRVPEPRGAHFVAVTSGGATIYAIDRSGHAWSWGSNLDGALGDGSGTSQRSRPIRLPIRVSQIASTAHTVIALARR